MNCLKRILKSLPFIVVASFLVGGYPSFLKKATAGYDPEAQTFVQIGDVDFGSFKTIKTVNDLLESDGDRSSQRHVITMKRDFITERSLANWAQQVFNSNGGQTDILLKIRTGDGQKIADVVLRKTKPISFRIEKSSRSTLDGYKEEVHFAAQIVDVY